MNSKLILSSSPHLNNRTNTTSIMRDVVIALIPALIASVIFFGPRTLLVTCVSIATCVIAEYICRKIMKRNNTIGDLSAVVTGLILALNLPSTIPIYIVIIGGVVAIVVVKQMFGGLGQNFANPAIAARVVLLVSFARFMTDWAAPFAWQGGAEALSTATPLGMIAEGTGTLPSYLDMFLGARGGSLGETCILALLIGFVYLLIRRVINPVIPVVYIGVVFLLSAALGQDPVMQILSGGLFLGAIFMATDYTTSPFTNKGKLIYAIGCGCLTVLIRTFASLPEGVSYSILLMNIITPLIDRITRPRCFGTGKGAA